MNERTFLENFRTIADAPGGVDLLRELIVDLGLRGELVSRVEAEGSAGDLLERVRVERSDRRQMRGVEETEAVYPIPAHWAWTTFGWITDSRLGKMLDQAKNQGTFRRYLRNTNVQWFRFDLTDVAEMRVGDREFDEYRLQPGDLLICEGGEPGRVAIVDDSVESLIFQKALHRSRPLGGTSPGFLAYLLWRDARNGRLEAAFTGATIKHLTGRSLASYPVPLPPAGEQERIVARIDELLHLCDDLEARSQAFECVNSELTASLLASLTKANTDADLRVAWSRVDATWGVHTGQAGKVSAVRQTILQLAVQGRLVPQREGEEPPSVALTRCANARQRAIADGRWRQQASLSARLGEPFPIPATWTWTQLDECFLVAGGIQKSSKRAPAGNSFPYLRVANVQRGALDLAEVEEFELYAGEIERYRLEPGDILVVEGNGSASEIGRCARWAGEIDDCVHQNHLIRCRPLDAELEAFVLLFLNSPHGSAMMRRLAVTTSGLYNLSVGKIRAIPIPLPPREERGRIVERVAELMHLCRSLETALDGERITRSALAASGVKTLVLSRA